VPLETVSAKIQIKISQGQDAGKVFTFTEHDTFVFGGMADCHACIPDDTEVSRHHFILEVNPPQACLRDLGSLNGTHVNGKKFGAREKGETPEEGARRRYPEVAIKHGDRIKVGRTELEVSVEQPKEAPQHRVDPALGDISLLSPGQLAKLIFGAPDQAAKPKLQIPGCKIEAEVGRGGFGAVYRARRADGSVVAVKVMLSRVDTDDEAIEKFKREVAVTAQLQHPNIARVFEAAPRSRARRERPLPRWRTTGITKCISPGLRRSANPVLRARYRAQRYGGVSPLTFALIIREV